MFSLDLEGRAGRKAGAIGEASAGAGDLQGKLEPGQEEDRRFGKRVESLEGRIR